MDVIAGTAGHIDHGKTALIKALTGVDADRLPEEKERGITIDLGFAEMEIADIRFGFVDVPGHERFVKNMLAGASGIDLVLLIVAADEGIMPQTREHFDICRLLGIHSGVIVLTKTDLVDDEMLELVRDEVAELVAGSFLAASPVVAVSSKNGEGISDLRAALIESARKLPERERSLITRLPIDRSFSVKGFGTVITGTLASGEIAEADELVVLPQGRTVRVRGLQTYGHAVKAVQAGQRTAVNLGGIDRDEVGRGMILTEKGTLRPTQMIDARLEVLDDAKRPLKSRQRVRVHIGTAEVLARLFVINETNEIALGESDFAQLRLELPVAAVSGERFVLRSYSPQVTIAGGTVLDPMPVKHKRSDIPDSRTFLGALAGAAGDEVERTRLFVERSGEHGISFSGLQASTGLRKDLLADTLAQNIDTREMIKTGNLYLSVTAFRDLRTQTIAKIKRHHQFDPLSQGIPKETLREKTFPYVALEVFKSVIADLEHDKKIRIEQDIVRSVEHKTKLSGEEATVLDRLRVIYAGMNLDVPKLDDGLTEAARMTRLNSEARRKVFQLLVDSREVVKINVDLYVSRTALDDVVEKLRRHAAATGDRSIEVPKFKEIAGVSRKYAIPLLEYFDREKITRRIGDKRLIL